MKYGGIKIMKNHTIVFAKTMDAILKHGNHVAVVKSILITNEGCNTKSVLIGVRITAGENNDRRKNKYRNYTES